VAREEEGACREEEKVLHLFLRQPTIQRDDLERLRE
jgi:hypothetical protein